MDCVCCSCWGWPCQRVTPPHQLQSPTSFAQTFDQILDLIEKGVSENDIIEQAKKIKVECKSMEKNMRPLIRAGAADPFLDALKEHCFYDLLITSPRDGDDCTGILKVEGKSVVVPDKHLWLFAHRRGLAVWWPQGGEVLVEDDGSWMQSAFMGNEADIGFKFEVKVMWVDEDVHSQMEEYLQRGEATQHFPGIRLPEGSPVAEVTCKKVSL